MTFSTWSQTAASNTAVGGISTDGTVTLVKQIDNMFRGMMAELAVARDDGTIDATGARGYLFGLTLSNNSGDIVNDIDIAVGECATSDSPYWKMALASVLTKRLDANWVVGTNQGGLDTGAIANTTYHIWLIARSDTGVVDALFSASATSPTMPASYDRKRRIGSIIRVAGTIKAFVQDGDLFSWAGAPLTDVNATNPGTAAVTRTLTLPTGIRINASLLVSATGTAAVDHPGGVRISDLSTADAAASSLNANFVVFGTTAGTMVGGVSMYCMTNTSAQVRSRIQTSTAGTTLVINTVGWIDTRGRI